MCYHKAGRRPRGMALLLPTVATESKSGAASALTITHAITVSSFREAQAILSGVKNVEKRCRRILPGWYGLHCCGDVGRKPPKKSSAAVDALLESVDGLPKATLHTRGALLGAVLISTSVHQSAVHGSECWAQEATGGSICNFISCVVTLPRPEQCSSSGKHNCNTWKMDDELWRSFHLSLRRIHSDRVIHLAQPRLLTTTSKPSGKRVRQVEPIEGVELSALVAPPLAEPPLVSAPLATPPLPSGEGCSSSPTAAHPKCPCCGKAFDSWLKVTNHVANVVRCRRAMLIQPVEPASLARDAEQLKAIEKHDNINSYEAALEMLSRLRVDMLAPDSMMVEVKAGVRRLLAHASECLKRRLDSMVVAGLLQPRANPPQPRATAPCHSPAPQPNIVPAPHSSQARSRI